MGRTFAISLGSNPKKSSEEKTAEVQKQLFITNPEEGSQNWVKKKLGLEKSMDTNNVRSLFLPLGSDAKYSSTEKTAEVGGEGNVAGANEAYDGKGQDGSLH